LFYPLERRRKGTEVHAYLIERDRRLGDHDPVPCTSRLGWRITRPRNRRERMPRQRRRVHEAAITTRRRPTSIIDSASCMVWPSVAAFETAAYPAASM